MKTRATDSSPSDSASWVTAYLGLGANLGDRQANIQQGLVRLAATPGIEIDEVSPLHESAAIGSSEPQGPYLNGAVRLRTCLEALALLQICKAVEVEAGRDLQAARNAARPLDLDLLLYGEQRIDTQALQVPHPRLLLREFVRQPLTALGVDLDALPLDPELQMCHDPDSFAALHTQWLQAGLSTGLVPTMGALHEGHLSLLRQARQQCQRVAATIFVNPLQFGDPDDLLQYPRSLQDDLEILRQAKVDAVFLPSAENMYPAGFKTQVSVSQDGLGMEDAHRPGHFQGVTTVVCKLLALARPSFAYVGQKDAQQVAVLQAMVRDLGFPTVLQVCATLRDPDGMAISSRNRRLDKAARQAATCIFRALDQARCLYQQGEKDAQRLLQAAEEVLQAEPRLQLEYLQLRSETDLQELAPGPVQQGRLLLAATVSHADGTRTRLIDNMSLSEPVPSLGSKVPAR